MKTFIQSSRTLGGEWPEEARARFLSSPSSPRLIKQGWKRGSAGLFSVTIIERKCISLPSRCSQTLPGITRREAVHTSRRLLPLSSAFQKRLRSSKWEGALLTSDVLRASPSLSVSLTCPWHPRSFTAQITKWPLQFPF